MFVVVDMIPICRLSPLLFVHPRPGCCECRREGRIEMDAAAAAAAATTDTKVPLSFSTLKLLLLLQL